MVDETDACNVCVMCHDMYLASCCTVCSYCIVPMITLLVGCVGKLTTS